MRSACLLLVTVATVALAATAGCSKGARSDAATHHPEPEPEPAKVMPTPPAAALGTVILTPPGGVPTRVTVEVMRTDTERERGLMYRTSLATDHGMIFLFDHDEDHTFWMKNTYIPLDMIFIADDRAALTVAGVVANAEPRTLTGRSIGKPSRHVLEVTAGWAAAHGVGPGTKVQLEAIDLKGVAP